ncbi:sensor histidine kinase [Devosia sp.]|uniref:sensor histidine kinase n=1 Tax=Devosia sp. TaxID=1871048 RepID=UPI003F712F42
MNDVSRPTDRKLRNALVAAWLLGLAAFALVSVWLSITDAQRQLEARGADMQRTIAQATAQHDAHLTSLATLALAGDTPPVGLFTQLAGSIIRFYPRITSIALLADGSGAPLAISGEALAARLLQQIESTAPSLPRGTSTMLAGPPGTGSYLLLKRTSDEAGRFLIALNVDASRLWDDADLPAGLSLQLALGEAFLVDDRAPSAGPGEVTLAEAWQIPSTSQPLSLHLQQRLTALQALPLGPFLAFAVATLLLAIGVHLLLQQRRATAQARARQRAQEHQLRLEHAARVNSMGELASGIAHELTQPLTALLSQSQAGLRLAGHSPPDAAALAGVLEANVRQARRAADILGRLRAYVSKSPTTPQPTDLNRVAAEVAGLLEADLRDKTITLAILPSEAAAIVLADPIELEQVLHNLVRNAADAIEASGRGDNVSISVVTEAGQVRVEVSDNGPGVPVDVLPHLFEPFYSTKPAGMGLGLPLCQTLVERFGGSIEAANTPEGGARFIVRLPLNRGGTHR